MGDESLLVEPFAVQEIYVDSFEHTVLDGMMMAIGYRIMPPCRPNGDPLRVVVVRIIMRAANVAQSIASARQALNAPFVFQQEDRIGRH